MLGQHSARLQTCGSSRSHPGAHPKRLVAAHAKKRQPGSRQGFTDTTTYPAYSLPPLDSNTPGAPPAQQQQQQQQQRAGPQGPAQPGFISPPLQPAYNPNTNPQQPGFVTPPPPAPPAAAPQQQSPAQGPPAQGFQQQGVQDPGFAVPAWQVQPQQQQQQQGGGGGGGSYINNGGWQQQQPVQQQPPPPQQGAYQQQQGAYHQQQQQPGWSDLGGFVDQGGYDAGGYMDAGGRVNPNDNGGYINRGGWQQQGNNSSGYYRNNRNNNQQQQQQSPMGFLPDQGQGGYINNWNQGGGGQRQQRNRPGFAGFDSSEAWQDDFLLQQLDAQMPPNMQIDGWVDEVEVEEDLTPKYVNGSRVLVNSEIDAPQVRVQDASKGELGVMSYDQAREMAVAQDVDVVLINKEGDPPVVRLIAFSKYKYELEKTAKQKQKASKGPEIKEVKLRPVTEKADYDTKVKQAQKFLSKGAKVKLTMTFSGREMRFKDQGKEMMLKLIEELSTSSKMEAPLALRPSNFSVTLVPLK